MTDQRITAVQVPGIVREAIEKAKELVDQKKYASAYDTLVNVAKQINSWGSTKDLRRLFSRPGGSWDSMGAGAAIWELPRSVEDAFRDLKKAGSEIPRTGEMDTYKDA